jgi:hypothetical protein
MDSDKIALLKELLADKDVKETLKKILLEDKPPKTAKKKPAKKVKTTDVKNKVVSEDSFKTNKKIVDKLSKEYGRRIFKDDLSEAIEEEIDGEVINLVEESKKISKVVKKKPIREKKKKPNLTCTQCNKKFSGFGGYLCDNCLRGRTSNAE